MSIVQREAQAEAANWKRFASGNAVVPFPPGHAPSQQQPSESYCLRLMEGRVKIPTGVLAKYAAPPPTTVAGAAASTDPSLCWLQYRVSMCSTAVPAFFGSTWRSHEIPIVELDASGFGRVVEPVLAYFHTSIRDATVVVVVEAVVVFRDRLRRSRLGECSVGWAALNLLSPSRVVVDVRADRTEAVDVGLNAGSPLSLLFDTRTSPAVSILPKTSPSIPPAPPAAPSLQTGCKIIYRFNTHAEFRLAKRLLAENEIIGPWTILPGLATVSVDASRFGVPALSVDRSKGRASIPLRLPCLAGDANRARRGSDEPCSARDDMLGIPHTPVLAPRVQLRLWSISLRLPPEYETKLILAVAHNREVELALPRNTLKVSSIHVVKRTLTIAVHNGHTVLEGYVRMVGVPPTQPSDKAVVLDVEPEVRLISYCLDPRVAIVMSLDYEIAEPESSSTHISTVVSAHGMPPRSLTAPASSGASSAGERTRVVTIASQVYIPFTDSLLHVVNRADVDASLTGRYVELPLTPPFNDLSAMSPPSAWVEGRSTTTVSPLTDWLCLGGHNIVVGMDVAVIPPKEGSNIVRSNEPVRVRKAVAPARPHTTTRSKSPTVTPRRNSPTLPAKRDSPIVPPLELRSRGGSDVQEVEPPRRQEKTSAPPRDDKQPSTRRFEPEITPRREPVKQESVVRRTPRDDDSRPPSGRNSVSPGPQRKQPTKWTEVGSPPKESIPRKQTSPTLTPNRRDPDSAKASPAMQPKPVSSQPPADVFLAPAAQPSRKSSTYHALVASNRSPEAIKPAPVRYDADAASVASFDDRGLLPPNATMSALPGFDDAVFGKPRDSSVAAFVAETLSLPVTRLAQPATADSNSRVFVSQAKPVVQATAAKAVLASSRPRAHVSRDYLPGLSQSLAVVDAARHSSGSVVHRRTRTTLVRYGFGSAIEDVVPPVSGFEADIDVEMTDALLACSISLQFAGFQPIPEACGPPAGFLPPDDPASESGDVLRESKAEEPVSATKPPPVPSALPQRVYFTFQFFNVPHVKTEAHWLHKVSSGDDQHPASPLYVLLSRGSGSSDSKTDDNGALDPAKPTLIDIDPTLNSPDESRLLAEYLSEKTLHVEMWDGDSLLPVGEAFVSLTGLLRQKEKRVSVTREFDVTSRHTSVPGFGIGNVAENDARCHIGKLMLVMSSVGREGKGAVFPRSGPVLPSSTGTPVGGSPAQPDAVVRTSLRHPPPAPIHSEELFTLQRGSDTVSRRKRRVKVTAHRLTEDNRPLSEVLQSQITAVKSGPHDPSPAVSKPTTVPGGDISDDTCLSAPEWTLLKARLDASLSGYCGYQELLTVLAADPVTLTPQHSQLFRFGAAISPEQAADLAEVTLKKEILAAEARGNRVTLAMRAADREAGESKENGELNLTQFKTVLDRLGCVVSRDDIEALAARHGRQRGDLVTLVYNDVISAVLDADPGSVANKWLVHTDRASESAHLIPGPPLKPEEIILVGKVRRAMQRAQAAGSEDLLTALRACDHSGSGRIAWSEVARVIHGLLKLAVPSEGFGEMTSRGASESSTQAALLDRQRRRAQAFEKAMGFRMESRKTLMDDTDALAKQRELELLQLYREGKKQSLVSKVLTDSVTSDYHIYPSCGRAVFMELPIKNPYSQQELFAVRIEDSLGELSLVTDSEEWRFLREVLPLSCGPPIDASRPYGDMVFNDAGELLLMSQESMHIPLVFRSFAGGDVAKPVIGADRLPVSKRPLQTRVIVVQVVGVAHGKAIALLRVHVHPQPYSVNRVVRYFSPESEYLREQVTLPSASLTGCPRGVLSTLPPASFDTTVHCCDKDVVLECVGAAPSSLKFRYCVGGFPSTGDFLVFVYNDRYLASLSEIWQFVVHATMKHDFTATLGQTTVSELIVKGDTITRRAKLFSTRPWEVSFGNTGEFPLVHTAINKLQMFYQGLEPGQSNCLVHLVDCDEGKVLCAWRISVGVSLPDIARTYDIALPVGKALNKKIAFENLWHEPKHLRVRSSHPTLLIVKQPRLNVEARQRTFIRLWFAPNSVAGNTDMYLFVNNDKEQTEECLLIRVRYFLP